MTEKELISKIKELKRVKPREDWVVFSKTRILGSPATIFAKGKIWAGKEKVATQPSFVETLRWLFQFKPAFASLVVVAVVIGCLGFAQGSLPGDILYPLKKATERSQVMFMKAEVKPVYQLKITNKRLEELAKIVEEKQEEKLAPSISEVQDSLAQVPEDLKRAPESLEQIKEPEKLAKVILEESHKLKETKEVIEETLATKIVSEELEQDLDEALAPLYKSQAENLIKEMEESNLTEEQEMVFAEAKQEFEQGNYEGALEKLLLLTQ